MRPERFSYLLSLVQERISKEDTRFRKSISAEERKQSVSRIAAETCKSIYLSLKDIYFKSLKTPEKWENTYSKFEEF